MNRRLVLIDSNEVSPISFYGSGLGTEIYDVNEIRKKSEQEQDQILQLGKTDAALVVGSEAFKILRERYHFGIRSENYFDCSQLYRLSIEGGAFIKVLGPKDPLTQQIVQSFMSPEFCQERNFSYFEQRVIHTYQEAIPFLDFFFNLPLGTDLGFDYEASGMPMDVYYEITGAALCTFKNGAFFSFSDIKRTSTPEQFNDFMYRFGAILQKHQEHIWTYNLQYEQQATWRVFGLDLEFCDAGVYNIIEAYHLKKYSLKWTAQRVLAATVWDTDFDRLSDLFDEMYFEIIQEPGTKGKKNQKRVLKVTPENYKNTPEWAKIIQMYPAYQAEFELLISEYFGQPFMNIPSEILGFYCVKDAFMTLEIHLESKDKYSQDCIQIFLDNLRMGAVLHSCGMYKDEVFRQQYDNYCLKMMTYGITYCSTARCKLRMDEHAKKANDINSYSPFCKLLIERCEFFQGNVMDITKNLLLSNLDTGITYTPETGNEEGRTGLNTGAMLYKYGFEFSDVILQIEEALREALIETSYNKPKTLYAMVESVDKKTGAIKQKKVKSKDQWTVLYGPIDDSICRKKKLLDIIAPKIEKILELDKIDLGEGHQELEKYIWYKNSYERLNQMWYQMPDINNVPDIIVFEGREWDLDSYCEYISNTYFKCKSPIENDEIVTELTTEFRKETVLLAALGECVQQLSGEQSFYKNLGIQTIEDAFNHFMGEWRDWETDVKNFKKGLPCIRQSYSYPQKMFDLAGKFWKNSGDMIKYYKTDTPASIEEPIKTTWADFGGFFKQADFFSYIKKGEYRLLGQPWTESDLNNTFFFMRKMCLMYLEYKKHAKILSTYIRGMFKDKDKCVIDTDRFYPIRHADPNEPGAVYKIFSQYEICQKTSKRSSSGWHTIVSHSDIKSVPCTPKGYLLTYYDISSAEVKSAGFKSMDPNMIDKFIKNEDIYVFTGKMYKPNGPWDTDPGFKKTWRKKMKTVFLGILYGLGSKSLAESLNCSEAEALNIIESVFTTFPKLKEYIETQQKYPFNNDGRVNTFFGDIMYSPDYKYLYHSDGRIDRATKSRVERHAVNLPIQGGTSVAMTGSFYNVMRQAKKEGFCIRSIITVHDSCTSYIPVEKLWEILGFCKHHFTDWCYDKIGIKLVFDMLVGTTYQDACDMKQIDDRTISFSGNAHSILRILDKLDEVPEKVRYHTDIPREQIIPEYVEDAMERFIKEKGTSLIKDDSYYTVKLYKDF